MSAPTIQTHAELRDRYIPVDLDRLPVDPDGWCSWEVAEGGWVHTALCRHGVENGGPRLCEMWAERDRRDAARMPRHTTRSEAEVNAYEWNLGPHRPEWEITEAARKAAARRAGGDS